MGIQRRKARVVKIGDRFIGGDYPILVQSMTKSDTRDVQATVREIKKLETAGCEIIRVAVPDENAVRNLSHIKKQISIPLIADIHFNWDLALKAIEQGVDKIRIGYKVIGSADKTKDILKTAKERGIPIRIGVNAGSLDDDIKRSFGYGVQAMVESAKRYVQLCEDNDFFNIVLSIKSSNALETIQAYELLSKIVDYPLHLGVTNAGMIWNGTINSAVGIGSLLSRGIGDTIRVSLTGPSIEEVKVGWQILKSLDLRQQGVTIISCPTCGRLEIGESVFVGVVRQLEEVLSKVNKQITISIIGCAVNGPGEALKADLGVMIIGKDRVALFQGNKLIKKIAFSEINEAISNFVRHY